VHIYRAAAHSIVLISFHDWTEDSIGVVAATVVAALITQAYRRDEFERLNRILSTMASLFNKMRVFALVQCAMLLVFVLEVTDRLLFASHE
jgi:hypothetical protein